MLFVNSCVCSVCILYNVYKHNILLIFLFLLFSSLIIRVYLLYFITSILYVNKFIVSELKVKL